MPLGMFSVWFSSVWLGGLSLRVSACGLDERVPWFYAAAALGFFDHAEGDAVFDAAACVEVFEFGVDGGFDAEVLGELVEFDHGRVADLLGDCVHDHGWDLGVGDGRHLLIGE